MTLAQAVVQSIFGVTTIVTSRWQMVQTGIKNKMEQLLIYIAEYNTAQT